MPLDFDFHSFDNFIPEYFNLITDVHTPELFEQKIEIIKVIIQRNRRFLL